MSRIAAAAPGPVVKSRLRSCYARDTSRAGRQPRSLNVRSAFRAVKSIAKSPMTGEPSQPAEARRRFDFRDRTLANRRWSAPPLLAAGRSRRSRGSGDGNRSAAVGRGQTQRVGNNCSMLRHQGHLSAPGGNIVWFAGHSPTSKRLGLPSGSGKSWTPVATMMRTFTAAVPLQQTQPTCRDDGHGWLA